MEDLTNVDSHIQRVVKSIPTNSLKLAGLGDLEEAPVRSKMIKIWRKEADSYWVSLDNPETENGWWRAPTLRGTLHGLASQWMDENSLNALGLLSAPLSYLESKLTDKMPVGEAILLAYDHDGDGQWCIQTERKDSSTAEFKTESIYVKNLCCSNSNYKEAVDTTRALIFENSVYVHRSFGGPEKRAYNHSIDDGIRNSARETEMNSSSFSSSMDSWSSL
jgi:hypothetical protein